jgi:hypothetical protein
MTKIIDVHIDRLLPCQGVAHFAPSVAPLAQTKPARKRGVNLMKVCDQTGHKSLEMLRVYNRDAELFAGNAAAGLL